MESNVMSISIILFFIGAPLLCFMIFLVLAYREAFSDTVDMTDEQAQQFNDTLHRQIQEQEAERLLLIEKENKDINLDEED